MTKITLPLICLILCSFFQALQAQSDPFAVIPSHQDAAALSPNELISFQAYCAAPENIQISSISAKDLSYALEHSRERIVLLDARSNKEYNISHIEDSKRLGFKDFSIERIWMLDRKSRVIVYSAHEKRALLTAQYLTLMGFTDIQLLKQGLIGWKNTGNEIFDKDGKTDKVHVGSRTNLKLLKSGLGLY